MEGRKSESLVRTPLKTATGSMPDRSWKKCKEWANAFIFNKYGLKKAWFLTKESRRNGVLTYFCLFI